MTNSGDVPPYADSEIVMRPTDDLVDRLRFHAATLDRLLCIEAADRIEALEASHLWQFVRKLEQDNDQLEARIEALEKALRKIADLVDSEADEPLDDAIKIARAALDKERKS